jgi:hypothetical protein
MGGGGGPIATAAAAAGATPAAAPDAGVGVNSCCCSGLLWLWGNNDGFAWQEAPNLGDSNDNSWTGQGMLLPCSYCSLAPLTNFLNTQHSFQRTRCEIGHSVLRWTLCETAV